jgi:hypothetical protein
LLTRTVTFIAGIAVTLLMSQPALAASSGPPLTTGGDHTTVLHCNALGFPGFVGAIVTNPNGEFGSCHFTDEP